MALGLPVSGGSGEIRPYIAYDARAGRMFRIDRTQDAAGNWTSNKVDITRVAKFVADLDQIKVGWVNFTPTGPIKRMVTFGTEPIPPRPDDLNAEGKPAFRQGFEVLVLLAKNAGGGPAREFGSNAGCVIEAMDELHDAFLGAAEAKAGKLPVVALVDIVLKEVGKSSNYKPVFQIVGWVDRPDSLPKNGAPAPVQASAPAPLSPPPAAVAPPPAAVPQPAMADAFDPDLFG